MKQFLKMTVSVLIVAFILALSLRGLAGNPDANSFLDPAYLDHGPMELSPERGRFALTYAIAELHSYSFSVPLARFATPDVAYQNGQYVSLFAPGVSFIVLPGYILGSLIGLSQVGSFAVIALFALMNFFLVSKIARFLGASERASYIGAISFLFATPAFSYAVSLYQHHISVFLMLLAIYLCFRFNSWLSTLMIWLLIGIGFFVDYPNAFLMLPIALYTLGRSLSITETTKQVAMRVNLAKLVTTGFVIFPLLLLFWYNSSAYGNPLQLAGTLNSVDAIDASGNPVSKVTVNGKTVNAFTNLDKVHQVTTATAFQTRNLLNGFYIHFLSPDRGMLFFTPIVFIGLVGMFILYKKDKRILLFIAIAGVNILLYSMWGDPWGGWGFGSRYLIPTYALSGITIALLFPYLKIKKLIFVAFGLILLYSLFINTIGALTTSKMPPQVQILQLEQQTHQVEKYTYARNFQYIQQFGSSSFIYQAFAQAFVPADIYIAAVFILILLYLTMISLTSVEFATPAASRHKVLYAKQRRKK